MIGEVQDLRGRVDLALNESLCKRIKMVPKKTLWARFEQYKAYNEIFGRCDELRSPCTHGLPLFTIYTLVQDSCLGKEGSAWKHQEGFWRVSFWERGEWKCIAADCVSDRELITGLYFCFPERSANKIRITCSAYLHNSDRQSFLENKRAMRSTFRFRGTCRSGEDLYKYHIFYKRDEKYTVFPPEEIVLSPLSDSSRMKIMLTLERKSMKIRTDLLSKHWKTGELVLYIFAGTLETTKVCLVSARAQQAFRVWEEPLSINDALPQLVAVYTKQVLNLHSDMGRKKRSIDARKVIFKKTVALRSKRVVVSLITLDRLVPS